jgi:nucleoside phosphorylase
MKYRCWISGSDFMRGDSGHATVGVLTIIDEEFAAARELLALPANIIGTSYYVAQLRDDRTYATVLTQSAGRTNTTAEQATIDLIERFRPHFLILLGIAGGVGEGSLGDVILADVIEYYEYIKLIDGQELTRREPHDQPSEHLRIDFARPVQYEDWLEAPLLAERPGEPATRKDRPAVRTENLAVGEKLLADKDSQFQKNVLTKLSHCKAVDMESYGFLKAIFHARRSVHYNPMGLVIRGISDPVDSPQNQRIRDAWRSHAAKVAVAYGRSVVNRVLQVYPRGACCSDVPA